jgi:predicted acetyltransferase
MTPEIRPVRDDELPAYFDAMSTAFLDRPDVEKLAAEVRPIWDLSRCWVARDDGRISGTFRSWATEVTVPGGGRLPASAVSGVSVLPTHRRRGLLRGMAAAEHAAARERGEAVALLYASEYPIYGRFGYGPASPIATWTLDASQATFDGQPTGRVEVAKVEPSTRDAMREIFEQWRVRQPGELRRRDHTWDYDLGLQPTAWGPDWKGFVAVHRDESGAPDGYARSRGEEKWEQRQPRAILHLDELHGLTEDAVAGLWRFLASIDWVATIKAERRSPNDRLPWRLTNARAASVAEVGDGLWVRLLDLPRALEARTYAGDTTVVLEVRDPGVAQGRQRVELEAGREGATCRATDRSPDLTVDIAALGAAYLGGSRLRDAVLATGAEEHRPGALAEVDGLFRTSDDPWCSTFF